MCRSDIIVSMLFFAIKDDENISDASDFEAVTEESIYGISDMTIIVSMMIGDHHILLYENRGLGATHDSPCGICFYDLWS